MSKFDLISERKKGDTIMLFWGVEGGETTFLSADWNLNVLQVGTASCINFPLTAIEHIWESDGVLKIKLAGWTALLWQAEHNANLAWKKGYDAGYEDGTGERALNDE